MKANKMTSETVYIVEAGCYSARHVVAVFSADREHDARALAAQLEDGDVQVWPVNPAVPAFDPRLQRWHVEMTLEGTYLRHELRTAYRDSDTLDMRFRSYGVRTAQGFWADCVAFDLNEAIKITNELRIKELRKHDIHTQRRAWEASLSDEALEKVLQQPPVGKPTLQQVEHHGWQISWHGDNPESVQKD